MCLTLLKDPALEFPGNKEVHYIKRYSVRKWPTSRWDSLIVTPPYCGSSFELKIGLVLQSDRPGGNTKQRTGLTDLEKRRRTVEHGIHCYIVEKDKFTEELAISKINRTINPKGNPYSYNSNIWVKLKVTKSAFVARGDAAFSAHSMYKAGWSGSIIGEAVFDKVEIADILLEHDTKITKSFLNKIK